MSDNREIYTSALKEKKNLEQAIAEKEKHLASLGLFKGKEKAITKEQIQSLKTQLASLSAKLDEIAASEPDEPVSGKSNGIAGAKVGDVVSFGNYEQGTGKFPIQWIVLASEGSRRLLISKYAIEAAPYHCKAENITWEGCTLRKFLNNDFFSKAFSGAEQKLISSVKLVNQNNPAYGTAGGPDTTDKVFCLSIDEAKKYFEDDELRCCKATAYAKSKGVWADEGNGSCWWWLRSPGMNADLAAYVVDDGAVRSMGSKVNYDETGVRPALWVEIKS